MPELVVGQAEIGRGGALAMAVAGQHALQLLDRITDQNAKQEFYLTDIVALARAAESGRDRADRAAARPIPSLRGGRYGGRG